MNLGLASRPQQSDRVAAPGVSTPDRREWEEIASSDPTAVAEQFPNWMDAIAASTPLVDRSRLYRFADGRRFVLPLVARRGVPSRVASLWSYPNAWGIGGPVGADLDADAVDHIVADLRTLRAARISIRVEATRDAPWRHLADDPGVIVVPRNTHVADLTPGVEACFASVSKTTRRGIRRTQREDADIRVGFGGDLVDQHYELYLRSLQRWAGRQHEPVWMARARGTRRDPISKLRAMGRHLGDRFCVIVGFVDGEPAASVIVLLGPTVRDTRGAVDVELSARTGINDGVQWRAFELAIEYGATSYNMGESGSSAGISAFKERFGAVAVSSGEYRIERLPLTAADRAARCRGQEADQVRGLTMTSRTSDDRMTRNAAALIASSMITAVIGLVFWVVAARLLSTGDVGIGTAIVTSIVLLGNVATLGLRSGLIRFMSAAGSSAGRFIGTAYALCAAVAVVLAAGFVIGTPLWAADLIVLRERPIDAVLFAMACAVWTVFVLQDNVLTGLRQAVWVPVENLGYSIAKLAMVMLLASTGAWALPVAWSVPALIAAVPVNVLVFGRLLGQGQQRPADEAVFTARAVARFSIGDHAADMVRLLGAEVVVLFVLANRGAEDTAYVFFAMTIAATGQLVTANIVTAFIAEAAARPAHALDLARRAATQSLAIIVPGALVGVAVAPLVLRVFGATYADNGTTLLRLLALGAIPLSIVSLALGWARVERNIWLIIRIAGGTAAAPLLGILVFERWWGIDAIGWMSLFGHTALAVVLARTTLRPVWSGVMTAGAVDWLSARRSSIRRSRRAGAIAATLDELDVIHRDGPALSPRRLLASDNDVAVVMVDDPDSPLIVKIAVSERAGQNLDRHANALVEVRRAAAERADVLAFVPEVVESGECQGQRYLIETACPGETALAADHDTLVAIARGVSAVHSLHREVRVVDAALLEELVTRHVNVLLSERRLWQHLGDVQRLWATLRGGLIGRQVVVSRTHGDTWIGNALLRRDEHGVELSGLVDWEDSRAAGLAQVDLAHLWLSAQPGHLGETTVEAVTARTGWAWCSDLGVDAPGDAVSGDSVEPLEGELVLTLAWLHHVAGGLARAERFSLGGRWLAGNVVPVLESVTMLEELGWDRTLDGMPADAG